jgi:hypothetical protein
MKCELDFPKTDDAAVIETQNRFDFGAKTKPVDDNEAQSSTIDPNISPAQSRAIQPLTGGRNDGNDAVQFIADSEMQVCTHCGQHVGPDTKVCCTCGINLEISVLENNAKQTGGSVVNTSTTHYHQELPAATYTGTTFDGLAPPIEIYFNASKTYFENKMGFVHLLIHNPFSHVVENVSITIHGCALQQPLEGESPSILGPGQSISLRIPNLFPVKCGEDALCMAIKGNIASADDFHLIGTIPISILRKQQIPHSISIDITAPEIGDQIISLPNMQNTDNDTAVGAAEKWTIVELFFDRHKQMLQRRYFPKGSIHSNEYKIDPGIIQAMRTISPETAPVAALSTQDGLVYFIVPGHTLLMGRDARRNHMPLVLYPEKDHQMINRAISRNIHCSLFIRNKRVYIRDMSQTGVYINNERIIKNQNIKLPSGEILLFKNQLELEIRIVTDDEDIAAVLVKRLNNKCRHTYILAHGPLQVGFGQDLSLTKSKISNIIGFVYYRPHINSWCFLHSGEYPEEGQDKKLEMFQELGSGQRKLWFSHVRQG